MIFAFLGMDPRKQHVVDQGHQGVAQAVVTSVFVKAGEIVGYLTLGGECRFEAVASVAEVVEIACAGFVGQIAEQVAEHLSGDVGCGMEFGIDPEVVAVAQFVGGEGQSRIEYSEQAVKGVHRYLPYSEEAEHMVDTERIEVFGHLAHA